MATKRISRLLRFAKSKKNIENIENNVDIDRKRSRQFSQVSEFVTEKESDSDDGDEVLGSRGDRIGGKRTRRFSQLFATAPQDSSDEFSPSEDDEIKVKKSRTRDDIATMVFKLFNPQTTRQETKHKRNASTRSAVSFKPKPRKAKQEKRQARVKITANIKPFWKHQKQDLSPATSANGNAETLSLTPTVVQKARKTKHHRSTSVCDSKFSSISSKLSITSLTHELIVLTAEQSTILLHLIHKASRSLNRQERLIANFSANLAHLFARKERIIDGNKRLSKEYRKMLMAMMAGLRELVGRTFLKKAVFIQRSLQLTQDLETMLRQEQEIGSMSKAIAREVNDSETTLVGSPQADKGQRIEIISEEVNASSLTLAQLSSLASKHQIDIHNFQHALHILREDIGVQLQLDQALRAGIVGPCEDLRFPATTNERIAMRRFTAFVDGCLVLLGRRYADEGRVIKGLEILGGVLKGE